MIFQVVSWWAASTLLGALAFPVAWRVFHHLGDRGYGLSRALGLLGAGYFLWLGASTGLMHNNPGGAIGAVLLLLAAGLYAGRGCWPEMVAWVRANHRSLLVMEAIFACALAAWAFVRANNPEILATEKPMELAFLNSILRSETFPPRDPWLAGYAISYYYFGYVLLGLLTHLTGVSAPVAFNLGSALWFALTALGAYAVVFDLIVARRGSSAWAAPLLGPAFVLLTGNLEAFLDVLHARGAFWRQDASGQWASAFWSWLNIVQLRDPPAAVSSWIPTRYWWWWRASRVVTDLKLDGVNFNEVIDEFPSFSFLLADNHPHVLALPFVLLAVAFALQVYLNRSGGAHRHGGLRLDPSARRRLATALAGLSLALGLISALASAASGLPPASAGAEGLMLAVLAGAGLALLAALVLVVTGALEVALPRPEFWLAAWLFGSLAFLNTWDFPIYLALLLCAAWIGMEDGLEPAGLRRLAVTAVGLGVAGVFFYLPWYPSFTSQAGGILPNLAFPTRFPQFLIMFGVLLVPILVWLLRAAIGGMTRREWWVALRITLGVVLGLLLLSILLGALVAIFVSRNGGGLGPLLSELGAADVRSGLSAIAIRRAVQSWTALTLAGIFALCAVLAVGRMGRSPKEPGQIDLQSPGSFVIALVAIGALLVLVPDFIYLKDLFGYRINTVFKFYYAAWVLWGIAAAYVTIELWPRERTWPGVLRSAVAVPLLLGLLYPVLAVWTKTNGFDPPQGRTLDGARHLALSRPSEYEAIAWMNQNLPEGVVAEAVGGSYTDFGVISTYTGIPTVLGWEFHEVQWRGSAELQGTRRDDIARLYETRDWGETEAILERYGIDYVVVGPLERQAYKPLVEAKFEAFLNLIYQNPEVSIYAAPEAEWKP